MVKADVAAEGKPATKMALGLKPIAGAALGNSLEIYNFYIYFYFAETIGRLYFPSDSHYIQLMLSLATFGVGYISRPLGAIVIGTYADRAGRKKALTLTIVLMALGTGLFVVTPTYSAVGPVAPLLIVLARLLQGFSAGGEVGAATAYLIERAPVGRRGWYGSWQYGGQGLAAIAAAMMAYLLMTSLPADAVDSWGWRLAFLVGLLIVPIGFYIRTHMDETVSVAERSQTFRDVWKAIFPAFAGQFVVGILALSAFIVNFSIFGGYLIFYASDMLKMPIATSMLALAGTGVAATLGALLAGQLSDRFGRRPIMLIPQILVIAGLYPTFWLLNSYPTTQNLILVAFIMMLTQTMSGTAAITALTECFPQAIRGAGLSVTYSAATVLFGSTVNLIAAWLDHVTASPFALPTYLTMINALAGLAMLLLRPPHAGDPLK